MGKLDTLVNARGMADVCKVPMQYVLTRGQGIKIFSAVVYYASQRDQIIRTQESIPGDGIAYEGAIVLPPKIGMYLDQPVSVLDFNSLYPTNMIAYNLSPDTIVYTKEYTSEGFLVYPPKEKMVEIKAWITELEEKGYVFEEIDYDNKETGGKTVCVFVQPNDNPMTVGVLPKTLEIMLKKRKEFKQKMEDVQYDEAQRSVFNGAQLAYKVVANSIYGQLGSRTSPIRKMCVAACTTAVGRRSLLFAKSTVEADGAEVVYGDSVAKYTPVMVRIHGNINILRIDQLDAYGTGWMKYGDDGKELCEVQGVDSWTETGWTPIKSIIRHALVDGKKMVRVLTHTGVVDVTDDHSLVKDDGTPATSKEIIR
jgi:DNA polymerase elongation subunit (family B)